MRHWIEDRLDEVGKTKADLQRALGLNSPRVADIIRGRRRVQVDEVIPLAALLGLTEAAVLRKINHNQELQPATLGAIIVRGSCEAGMWRDAIEWPESEWYPAPVAGNPAFPKARQFGLEVRGPSMNLVFPPGSILVCVPVEDYPHSITPGRRVIAIRRSISGVEATVKELRQDASGAYWLWPRSDDPRFQEPWPIKPPADMTQDDEIRLLAVVVGSYRPEPT